MLEKNQFNIPPFEKKENSRSCAILYQDESFKRIQLLVSNFINN